MSKVKSQSKSDKNAKAPETDRPKDVRKQSQSADRPGAAVASQTGSQAGRASQTGKTEQDATAKNKPAKGRAQQSTAQKKK